ncbi:LysR family transcriptional regulator [Cryobacterium sp. CG_9.6]|uniref:LysR family transcriptional regulator n=1 Tax=Cryobacterium sp. CG_9.6 TaxID=2760710 RepID=UPI0024748EA6|nr:LysR family transcriptional regulator [Cryobacterium sp. CG_9.6]
MTMKQLRAFALVAKLGSLRAAAESLGISEPAVSSAIASLRLDLGDQLFLRSGAGIALTPGGRALAGHAQEIVGLADQIRWEVSHAETSAPGLRVLVTGAFGEHAAGRLLDAFSRRAPGLSVDVEMVVESAHDVSALLQEHAYDVALGSRIPIRGGGMNLSSVPFLRYHRVLVAAPGHPLAQLNGPVPLSRLPAAPWFTGPIGVEEFTSEGDWLAALPELPDLVALSSETDALAAVRAGEGIMLALAHIVRQEVADHSLASLPVPGLPVPGLWWATTLDGERASPAARTLQRFVTTAEATAAMLAPGGSRGLARRGSRVHVALWS